MPITTTATTKITATTLPMIADVLVVSSSFITIRTYILNCTLKIIKLFCGNIEHPHAY